VAGVECVINRLLVCRRPAPQHRPR
jgi:hypothetical protein